MPEPRKPAKPRKPTQEDLNIRAFSSRVEEMCPDWLRQYEARRKRLAQMFEQFVDEATTEPDVEVVDENGVVDEKATEKARRAANKQRRDDAIAAAQIHEKLCRGDQQLMRVNSIREQIAQEKGLTKAGPPTQQVTNNYLSLNLPPGLPENVKAELEKHTLAQLRGETLSLPAPTPAEVTDAA